MGPDHLVSALGEPPASIRRNFTLGRGGGVRLRAPTAIGRAPTTARLKAALLGQAVSLDSEGSTGWGYRPPRGELLARGVSEAMEGPPNRGKHPR